MHGELSRYARRGLTNVLNESNNDEFKQLVLMLKLIETNLVGKFEDRHGHLCSQYQQQQQLYQADMRAVKSQLSEILACLLPSGGGQRVDDETTRAYQAGGEGQVENGGLEGSCSSHSFGVVASESVGRISTQEEAQSGSDEVARLGDGQSMMMIPAPSSESSRAASHTLSGATLSAGRDKVVGAVSCSKQDAHGGRRMVSRSKQQGDRPQLIPRHIVRNDDSTQVMQHHLHDHEESLCAGEGAGTGVPRAAARVTAEVLVSGETADIFKVNECDKAMSAIVARDQDESAHFQRRVHCLQKENAHLRKMAALEPLSDRIFLPLSQPSTSEPTSADTPLSSPRRSLCSPLSARQPSRKGKSADAVFGVGGSERGRSPDGLKHREPSWRVRGGRGAGAERGEMPSQMCGASQEVVISVGGNGWLNQQLKLPPTAFTGRVSSALGASAAAGSDRFLENGSRVSSGRVLVASPTLQKAGPISSLPTLGSPGGHPQATSPTSVTRTRGRDRFTTTRVQQVRRAFAVEQLEKSPTRSDAAKADMDATLETWFHPGEGNGDTRNSSELTNSSGLSLSASIGLVAPSAPLSAYAPVDSPGWSRQHTAGSSLIPSLLPSPLFVPQERHRQRSDSDNKGKRDGKLRERPWRETEEGQLGGGADEPESSDKVDRNNKIKGGGMFLSNGAIPSLQAGELSLARERRKGPPGVRRSLTRF